MVLRSFVVAAVAVTLMGSPALAQQGSYAKPLKKMLADTAAGTCPADLMADALLAACNEQLARMGPELASYGPVRNVTFIKATGRKEDRVETYLVTFAKGRTAMWQIGKFAGGKFQTAFSDG